MRHGSAGAFMLRRAVAPRRVSGSADLVSFSGESCEMVLCDKNAPTCCLDCGTEGRPVGRQTTLHHIRHEYLDRVHDEAYRFCPDPNCKVIYYSESGTRFTIGEVRELVGAKTKGDTRPVCYCFGFTEGDIRKEIAREGSTTIPRQISRLIKAGMCACEVRNPAGACCLGEVNQITQRLSELHEEETDASGLASATDCCQITGNNSPDNKV
jgi:hypothetical protein